MNAPTGQYEEYEMTHRIDLRHAEEQPRYSNRGNRPVYRQRRSAATRQHRGIHSRRNKRFTW